MENFRQISLDWQAINELPETSLFLQHLVLGGINVYASEGGQGKTFLAYHVVASFLRSGFNVIYVDWDNPKSLPKDRGLSEFILSSGYADVCVYLTTDSFVALSEKEGRVLTTGEFLEYIMKEAPEGSVIVLDSLQNFLPNVSDDKETYTFMKLLRQYSTSKGITFLVIHHISKVNRWVKGSTNIVNMADMVFRVRAEKDNNGAIVSWGLQEEKYRYFCSPELTIKREEEGQFHVFVQNGYIPREEAVVLRAIIGVINRSETGERLQGEIVAEVKERLGSVGKNKIFELLKAYTTKGLFIERSLGDKNRKGYSVNYGSEIYNLLFPEIEPDRVELVKVVREMFPEEDIPLITYSRIDGSVESLGKRSVLMRRILSLSRENFMRLREAILNGSEKSSEPNAKDEDDIEELLEELNF